MHLHWDGKTQMSLRCMLENIIITVYLLSVKNVKYLVFMVFELHYKS